MVTTAFWYRITHLSHLLSESMLHPAIDDIFLLILSNREARSTSSVVILGLCRGCLPNRSGIVSESTDSPCIFI